MTCGLAPFCSAGVVAKLSLVFNLSRGPWNQGDFGKQLQEGAHIFQQLMTGDSGVVQEFLPHIAFDLGHSACPAGLAEEVLHGLVALPAFRSHGAHVTLRRWFSWTFAWEALDQQYSTVAMVLSWIAGQSSGWDRPLAKPLVIAGPRLCQRRPCLLCRPTRARSGL